MTDHTAIKRRKELWKSVLPTMRSGKAGTFPHLAAIQTKQLQAAARFFDVNIADPVDAAVLLRILADVVFHRGKAPGRRKGSKHWHAARVFLLGSYDERIRSENPHLKSYPGIAKELRKKYPQVFKNDSVTTLRQRLPVARKEYASVRRALELPPPVLGLGIAPTGGVLGL